MNWLPPTVSPQSLQLPSRPGIRKTCPICSLFHTGAVCVQELPRRTNHRVLKKACKCGKLHYTRLEILECRCGT